MEVSSPLQPWSNDAACTWIEWASVVCRKAVAGFGNFWGAVEDLAEKAKTWFWVDREAGEVLDSEAVWSGERAAFLRRLESPNGQGGDSFSILVNHCSFQKPGVLLGFDGFLERRIPGKNGEGTSRNSMANPMPTLLCLHASPKMRSLPVYFLCVLHCLRS